MKRLVLLWTAALFAIASCRPTPARLIDAGDDAASLEDAGQPLAPAGFGSTVISANGGNATSLNGATVPAAGSLTTGNVLQVSGSSATTYAALNLAGGAGYVTGSLPAGNQASQLGNITGGDVSCTTGGSATVNKISGSSPIAISPATLQWASTVSGPTLSQASTSIATQGQNMNFAAQTSTQATNEGSGDYVFALEVPIGSGTEAGIQVNRGATNAFRAGPLLGAGSTVGSIWLAPATPSSTNYNLACTTTDCYMDPGSGAFRVRPGSSPTEFFAVTTTNVEFETNQVAWTNATTPSLLELPAASTSAGSGAGGATMSIAAQAGQAATGGSNNGGAGADLALAGGSGGTSGSATKGVGGSVLINSGLKLHVFAAITASTYTVDTNGVAADAILFSDSTSNTVTFTLPAPAAGRCLWFKDKTGKAATHNVTISQHASETIDGASTLVFTKNYDAAQLCSDGTNWSIMSEFSSSIVP
jgi:hypothetical protein